MRAFLLILIKLKSMEEDYLICYCNEVHKSTIVNAIKEKGLKTVEEVGHETGAGQVCGHCRPDIQKLLDELNTE
jgi:NAD(P)H-nitrite reductase large subunit